MWCRQTWTSAGNCEEKLTGEVFSSRLRNSLVVLNNLS